MGARSDKMQDENLESSSATALKIKSFLSVFARVIHFGWYSPSVLNPHNFVSYHLIDGLAQKYCGDCEMQHHKFMTLHTGIDEKFDFRCGAVLRSSFFGSLTSCFLFTVQRLSISVCVD